MSELLSEETVHRFFFKNVQSMHYVMFAIDSTADQKLDIVHPTL